MFLPEDPAMLLSVVNTWVRDHGGDFDDFLREADADAAKSDEIRNKLAGIGYFYDVGAKAFKPEV